MKSILRCTSSRRHAGRCFVGAVLLTALWLQAARADGSEVQPPANRDANLAAAAAWTEAARTAAGDRASMRVRDAVVADREARTVRLLAEATGITPGEPVEFFLIALNSGHDYEALAVSFARPGDVHAALRFIGLPEGRPVDHAAMRMWPRGEHVQMHFTWTAPEGERKSLPAEHTLVDGRTGAPMEARGFVFTGSRRVELPDQPSVQQYGADVMEPSAIAANYNEPLSVLDVPFQAFKGDQYDHLSANPAQLLPRGALLEIVLTPERPAGDLRVRDLSLHVEPGAVDGDAGAGPDALACRLLDAAGAPAVEDTTLAAAEAGLRALLADKRTPFLSVTVGDAVRLADVRALHERLVALEGPNGVRLEPPPRGQLFFRSFLPDPRFRERATRPTQPWELTLRREGDAVTAELSYAREQWDDAAVAPTYTVQQHPAATPEALTRVLQEEDGKLAAAGIRIPRVLLVFAPGDLPHGELLRYLAPLLETFPTVYVCL